ncbi:MAG: tocopherol cyclase family protein [Myxococcota bacterium]|jgi:hypothetical protein
MFPTEKYNMPFWDGVRKGWYEVWYSKFNDPKKRIGVWLRYTFLVPYEGHGTPSYGVWGIFFDRGNPSNNRAYKHIGPIGELALDRERFAIHVPCGSMTQERQTGEVAGDGGGGIEWDLKMVPSTELYSHMPKIIYRSPLPRSKALSPNLSVPFTGTVRVDGRGYSFDGAPGHQSHHWGTKLPYRWAWANCNSFRERADAFLEAASGTYNEIGVETPVFSTFMVRLGGQDYHFGWKRNLLDHTTVFNENGWEVRAENRTHVLMFNIKSSPAGTVCACYTDPDCERKFCHNNTVADAGVRLFKKNASGRLELVQQLTSDGTCAFEVAQPDKIPGIPVCI